MPRLRSRLAALERRDGDANARMVIVREDPEGKQLQSVMHSTGAAGNGDERVIVIRRVNRPPAPVTR